MLDGQVLVIGGQRVLGGDQTTAILAIDPSTGRVRIAGRLHTPLSDAMAASTGGSVTVAGGDSGAGAQQSIIRLTPSVT